MNPGFRAFVCDRAPNPPVHYAFPPQEYATKQSPIKFLRHVRQTRFALLEYYHASQYSFGNFYSTYTGASNENTKTRIAARFLTKIQEVYAKGGGTVVLLMLSRCYFYV
jgi:hypothetical protein